VIKRLIQFVDRPRPEGVPDLGPIERDADRAGVHGTVVGDVGVAKPVDVTPPPGWKISEAMTPILPAPRAVSA
jgi:hypothetical protein